MSKLIFLSIFLFFYSFNLNAQEYNYTLSGIIKDSTSGEVLIGASILVKGKVSSGASTNDYGFYSLTLKKGTYKIIFTYIGYYSDTLLIELNSNLRTDINLQPLNMIMEEIVVVDEKENNIEKPISGNDKINIKDIESIPILFGEKNILKTIQLLPGIKGSNESSTGFSVRGGNYDQNLILLDEAPVYNVSHLLGFFSTFNSDVINDVNIFKGTQPSQYGGRISSVLDIKMKDGNNKNYSLSGGIGLISAKLNIEGPIVKSKGSFIVAARRSYADLFLKLSSDENIQDRKLYFYDVNTKANYELGKNDKIFLSGYFGKDVLGFGSTFSADWGNTTGTLRWNHIFSSKLFLNTSLIYSNYNYNISINDNSNDYNISSRITDLHIKNELQYYINAAHSLRFGFNLIKHEVTPGIVDLVNATAFSDNESLKRKSFEYSVWVGDDWAPTNWIRINAGIRVNSFNIIGEGDFYTLDNNNNIIDTTNYNGGVIETYVNPEPRLSASIILNNNNSLKFSFTRNTQNIHLLTNSTSSNPTDKWVSSTNNIKPEVGDQFSLGYYKNINGLELNIEGYYKRVENIIDYKDNANVTNTAAIESQLLFGKGRSFGIELFLKKKVGKFTGWISYMLSRTEQKIEGINNSNWYPSKQDRTHDISVVLMFDINPKFNLSATWVYNTGNAVTFPSGKYIVNNQVTYYYTERNGNRMPDYHRLDVGGTLKLGAGKRFSNNLSFGLYNAYGRKNTYSIDFRENYSNPNQTEAVKTYLFQWVPYISWNFKF